MIASPARLPGVRRIPRSGRRAMTLLEVLTALAIFLMAMAVFGGIFLRNGQIALDVERQDRATRLCQSKMHEISIGVVPLTSQGDTPFDEEPDYTWALDAQNGSVDGLWNVTVTVNRRQTDGGGPIQCVLTQMLLDPSLVGSDEDVVPVTSSTASNTGSNSSTNASPTSSTSGK